MDSSEEAELRKYIGDKTGDYDSTLCHSFLIVYVDDFLFVSVDDDQLRGSAATPGRMPSRPPDCVAGCVRASRRLRELTAVQL